MFEYLFPEKIHHSWYYDQMYIYFMDVYVSYFRISDVENDFRYKGQFNICTSRSLHSFVTLLMDEKTTVEEHLLETKLSKKGKQTITMNKNSNYTNVIILKIKNFLNDLEIQELKFLSMYFKFKYYLVDDL